MPSIPMPGPDPSRGEGGKPVVFIAIVIGVILGIGGAGGYWVYKHRVAPPAGDVVATNTTPQQPTDQQPAATPNPESQQPSATPAQPAESTPPPQTQSTPPAAAPTYTPPANTPAARPAQSHTEPPRSQAQQQYVPPTAPPAQPTQRNERPAPTYQPPAPVAEPQRQAPQPTPQTRPVEPPPQQTPQPEPARRPLSPPPAEAAPYNGPQSGVLTYSGPPVVQSGEIVFEGLPPGTLTLSYDMKKWDGRLVPGRNNTQRLILRSLKSGTQKQCVVRWHL